MYTSPLNLSQELKSRVRLEQQLLLWSMDRWSFAKCWLVRWYQHIFISSCQILLKNSFTYFPNISFPCKQMLSLPQAQYINVNQRGGIPRNGKWLCSWFVTQFMLNCGPNYKNICQYLLQRKFLSVIYTLKAPRQSESYCRLLLDGFRFFQTHLRYSRCPLDHN